SASGLNLRIAESVEGRSNVVFIGPAALIVHVFKSVAAVIAEPLVDLLPMRHTPTATPDVKFTPQAAGIPKKTRELFLRDHAILKALLASCMFWLCAGIVQ
ncbi:hypothetical protein AB1L30_00490, partial [Bremerella sp. JC817]